MEIEEVKKTDRVKIFVDFKEALRGGCLSESMFRIESLTARGLPAEYHGDGLIIPSVLSQNPALLSTVSEELNFDKFLFLIQGVFDFGDGYELLGKAFFSQKYEAQEIKTMFQTIKLGLIEAIKQQDFDKAQAALDNMPESIVGNILQNLLYIQVLKEYRVEIYMAYQRADQPEHFVQNLATLAEKQTENLESFDVSISSCLYCYMAGSALDIGDYDASKRLFETSQQYSPAFGVRELLDYFLQFQQKKKPDAIKKIIKLTQDLNVSKAELGRVIVSQTRILQRLFSQENYDTIELILENIDSASVTYSLMQLLDYCYLVEYYGEKVKIDEESRARELKKIYQIFDGKIQPIGEQAPCSEELGKISSIFFFVIKNTKNEEVSQLLKLLHYGFSEVTARNNKAEILLAKIMLELILFKESPDIATFFVKSSAEGLDLTTYHGFWWQLEKLIESGNLDLNKIITEIFMCEVDFSFATYKKFLNLFICMHSIPKCHEFTAAYLNKFLAEISTKEGYFKISSSGDFHERNIISIMASQHTQLTNNALLEAKILNNLYALGQKYDSEFKQQAAEFNGLFADIVDLSKVFMKGKNLWAYKYLSIISDQIDVLEFFAEYVFKQKTPQNLTYYLSLGADFSNTEGIKKIIALINLFKSKFPDVFSDPALQQAEDIFYGGSSVTNEIIAARTDLSRQVAIERLGVSAFNNDDAYVSFTNLIPAMISLCSNAELIDLPLTYRALNDFMLVKLGNDVVDEIFQFLSGVPAISSATCLKALVDEDEYQHLLTEVEVAGGLAS